MNEDDWLLHALGLCDVDGHECWYDTIGIPTEQDIYDYIKSYIDTNYTPNNKIFYGGGTSDLSKMAANGEITLDKGEA